MSRPTATGDASDVRATESAAEIWKPIPFAPGYDVSDQGRVRSWRNFRGLPTPRLLTPTVDGGPLGYLQVALQMPGTGQRSFRVQRLVAASFLGPRPEGMHIRHLDGDPQNNALSNLAYGTPRENADDKLRHGTHLWKNRKTHCARGHEFTPENTYVRPGTEGGHRRCIACRRESDRRSHAKRAVCPICGESKVAYYIPLHIRRIHSEAS